jgi:hypothetical protein
MNFSDFEKLISLMVESSGKMDSALGVGIDLIEFTEPHNQTVTFLLSQVLTTDGLDWFNWFLYEKGAINDGIGKSAYKAWATIDGEEVEIVSDVQSLFDYLKTNDYFKCDQK